MAIGTLRDQVIYPDSVADMKSKGLGDEFIKIIIEKVITYLRKSFVSFSDGGGLFTEFIVTCFSYDNVCVGPAVLFGGQRWWMGCCGGTYV